MLAIAYHVTLFLFLDVFAAGGKKQLSIYVNGKLPCCQPTG